MKRAQDGLVDVPSLRSRHSRASLVAVTAMAAIAAIAAIAMIPIFAMAVAVAVTMVPIFPTRSAVISRGRGDIDRSRPDYNRRLVNDRGGAIYDGWCRVVDACGRAINRSRRANVDVPANVGVSLRLRTRGHAEQHCGASGAHHKFQDVFHGISFRGLHNH
jgi:hypothetical protein